MLRTSAIEKTTRRPMAIRISPVALAVGDGDRRTVVISRAASTSRDCFFFFFFFLGRFLGSAAGGSPHDGRSDHAMKTSRSCGGSSAFTAFAFMIVRAPHNRGSIRATRPTPAAGGATSEQYAVA